MHINSIVSKIIAEKISCFFISPHLDDAVFSAGGLLLHLAAKTKVAVVTVFSEASPPPYTLSAKAFLKKSGGYCNALDLFKERRSEDMAACHALKVKSTHLGLIDASFRKKNKEMRGLKFFNNLIPELNYIYPIYRLHVVSGKISRDDKDTLLNIKNKLQAIEGISGRSFVFCPYGAGGHVDHVIVRKVCQKIFSNLILWDDFPYNREAKEKKENILKLSLGVFDIFDAGSEKIRTMFIYKSQIRSIFLHSVELMPEVYYEVSDKSYEFL